MAKLTTFTDFGRITDSAEFMRFASAAFSELQSIINGKVEFDVNIASQTQTVYFPSANVDLSITHGLERSNVKYLVAQKTGPCDIYNGSAATTNSTVALKSTAAGVTVTLILF